MVSSNQRKFNVFSVRKNFILNLSFLSKITAKRIVENIELEKKELKKFVIPV